MRQRWGCNGRRGQRGLAERAVAQSVEKLLALPEGTCSGCPFEGLYHRGVAGGHVGELLNARLLVVDERLPWDDALGRPLAAVDVDALAAWKHGRARIEAAEARERQRQRDNPDKPNR